MAKKKIGLALGGGAARGLAHIGVLEVLAKENIPIDYVAGTSAGAIAGALYAAGVSPSVIKERFLSFDHASRRRFVDLKLPVSKSGFVQGKRIIQEMQTLMGGDMTFTELSKPFACVACNIISGEEVILSHGSVCKAVHASIAIPVIFNPVKLGGHYLVDGWLVNAVPVSVVRAMGAEFVIAVNVIPQEMNRARDKGSGVDDKAPGFMTIVINAVDIASIYCAKTSMAGADAIIAPQTADFTPTDFSEAKSLIIRGEMAANSVVPDIRRHIAQW